MNTTSAVVTQFSANTKKQQKQTAKEIRLEVQLNC
jgi:hypothetical protein